MNGFTLFLSPPILPIEAVVLHFQQRNTDLQPSVEFWIASLEKGDCFETDVSTSGTTISRNQSEEVRRWLLEDCACQPVLFPPEEALAEKGPRLRRTSESVANNPVVILLIHTLHYPA